MKYPRAYKRNTVTRLLWLYKSGLISFIQYANAKAKYSNKYKED